MTTFKEAWGMWSSALNPHVKKVTGFPSWLWNKPMTGKKSSYYPSGEASLSQLYSPEGMRKGGAYIRKSTLSRVGGFGKGIVFGAAKPAGTPKKENALDKFKNMLDSTSGFIDAGKERVEDPFGGWSFQDWINEQTGKIPKAGDIIPEGGLVQIPTVDLTPVKEGMDDFAMALAMGLGSLGQGIGGGMPGMPSMELIGDDGEPNILMLGGLAAVAYVVLKKVK